MKKIVLIVTATWLSACTVQGDGGIELTRPIAVKASAVQVFRSASEVKEHFSVIESVFVKDDGETLPRVLEGQLREMAGARGANAIITDPTNRQLNGLRMDIKPTLDDPFEYFSATAIWIGDGKPPQKHLGTLGRGSQ